VLITNDGATILDKIAVIHPTAKMVQVKHFPSNFLSLLKFQKHKTLKLVMAQPQLLC